MIDYAPVGLILAGGRSTRMGTNKAFLQIQNHTLIDRAIHLLSETGLKRLLISGSLPGYECLPDHTPNEGPIGGIRTAYTETDASAFLIIPVDMPALTPNILTALIGDWEAACFEGLPLPCFLRRCPNVERALALSSVKGLLSQCNAVVLKRCDPSETFQNLNTPADFDAFQLP